ncbi:MAG TPA: response regulator [Bacillota bacterium]|nr:response regulator [Bacillota bacterium]
MRVLIADDEFLIREVLKANLEISGFEVVGEAENGSIAVQKYQELRPDIVIMDFKMPIMDGFQATREIVSIDSSAKVVIVSAMRYKQLIEQAIESGAKHFMEKPFH